MKVEVSPDCVDLTCEACSDWWLMRREELSLEGSYALYAKYIDVVKTTQDGPGSDRRNIKDRQIDLIDYLDREGHWSEWNSAE